MSTNPNPIATRIRPQFLKVPEVAELLRVKPRTIYEMVARELIPYRKPPAQAFCVLTSMRFWLGQKDAMRSHSERFFVF